MNPYELMELKKDNFTKNELILYEYVKNHSYEIFRGTISTMSRDSGVSQPSITRFCKKLGYENFSEFKMYLYSAEKTSQKIETEMNFPALASYIHLINKIDLELTQNQLINFAKSILKANRVYIVGNHKSKLSAELLHYNIMKFGIHTNFFTSDDSFEICNIGTKKDLAIIISAQGLANRFFIKELEHNDIPTALITMNAKIMNKKHFEHFFWLPNYKNQNELTYTENMVIFSIFVDLLTFYIAKEHELLKSK